MPDMTVPTWQLRARFALGLSQLYGQEVPAYNTLVQAAARINSDVLRTDGAEAQRLGSIERVSAERHGAIRIGTARELAQVATIFGALGMFPVGYYDLRDAQAPVPVVSTAFRPIDTDQLARNPFRVFTSVLAVDDRRFFDAELQSQLHSFLDARELFSPELLALADRAEAEGGLPEAKAQTFLELATGAFALSQQPVDRRWYERLERVSSVAADIGGVGSTHINHLTPRVLDIDALYADMLARGIEMIDEIQGPPRWNGPDVLLRQTSFRALAENRLFTEADGSITNGSLRVRFGEVEARGIALTAAGRARYDALMVAIDRLKSEPEFIGAGANKDTRNEAAAKVFNNGLPDSEVELACQDLAFFTFDSTPNPPRSATCSAVPGSLSELLHQGFLQARPQVYEDFLPRSAAGIFASNLTSDSGAGRGRPVHPAPESSAYDTEWLEGALQRSLLDPNELYQAIRDVSLATAAASLGIPEIEIQPAETAFSR